VIDDGSTDNTEEVIATYSQAADFPVRFVPQDHAGKHFAHNRALIEARGRIFANVDSDDALVPDALEKMAMLWDSVPEDERSVVCLLGGLCRDQHGKLVGDTFPANPFDCDLRELLYIHHIKGEKWILAVTDVMRLYPLPEIPDTDVTQGLVWLQMAKTFKTRWLNEVVRIYYIDDPQTGATITQLGNLGHHAVGRWHYYAWVLNNDLEYFFNSPAPFLKAALMLPIAARSSAQFSLSYTFKSLQYRSAKVLVGLALPFALLLYAINRIRATVSSTDRSGGCAGLKRGPATTNEMIE